MKNKFGKDFWSDRWKKEETSWDMGSVSTPLKEYIDSITNDRNKYLKILIPGCGNAYEAEYLNAQGFRNVYVIDFAKEAIEQFTKRVPGFPKGHLICGDFFEMSEKNFDLILEQTFFCAINPVMRTRYAEKMFELLSPKGHLVGLLFNDPELGTDPETSGPPFGGDEKLYKAILGPYFTFDKFEPAYNSIPPRAGRELFINLHRKDKIVDHA
jgi:SAM-dependent methyltransferase